MKQDVLHMMPEGEENNNSNENTENTENNGNSDLEVSEDIVGPRPGGRG